MAKKLLAMLLVALTLLSLASCGGDKGNGTTNNPYVSTDDGDNGGDNVNTDVNGFVAKGFYYDESTKVEAPSVKLDPKEIYGKITYNEKMFYGRYCIKGGDKAEKQFSADGKYTTYTLSGKEAEMTVLPFEIEAGKDNFSHVIYGIKEYDWMRVYYMKKSGTESYLHTLICAYTVEGKKLVLKPVDTFKYEEESNKITYKFDNFVLEYDFEFCGRTLKLSKDGESITLHTGLDAYGEVDYFHADGYLSPDSKPAAGLDRLTFYYNSEEVKTNFNVDTLTDEYSDKSIAVLEENGLFTFTVVLKESIQTYQYVYFYCDDEGIILTDGTDVYYYNDSYSDRNKWNLKDYITEEEGEKLEKLPETKVETIVEKKENLFEDLIKAFTEAGINVNVNEKTGEMALDATVLFGGDSAVLTDAGKEFLNKFISAYTSIVFSEKYDGFISKTIIEGHSAPMPGVSYDKGLPLSVNRANAVKDYCSGTEHGVDTTKLSAALEAIGYSNSRPVYDADGNPDMPASRRVSFRFMINLEQ